MAITGVFRLNPQNSERLDSIVVSEIASNDHKGSSK
jgi:hypothetical protein